MSGKQGLQKWLRLYPEPWRRRYGGELLALLEDRCNEEGLGLRAKVGLAFAGLRERASGWGLYGRAAGPAEAVRGGSLVVLWAWAGVVLAGAEFQKVSENWGVSIAMGQALVPRAGIDIVTWAAGLGLVSVLLGVVACLPSLARYWRAGGLREQWPWLGGALLCSVVAVSFLGAMVPVARGLSFQQRNGALWWYSALFGVLALLVGLTVASWTAAAGVVFRRLELPARAVRLCGWLAVLLTLAIAGTLAGAVTWWVGMASYAPWFLAGKPEGATGAYFPLNMAAAVAVMSLALLAGVFGAARVMANARQLRSLVPGAR